MDMRVDRKGELARQLGVFEMVLITVAGITPASSVFVIVPLAIHQAGTGVFLAFLIAALLAFAFSLCYAELGAAHRHAGGEYVIARRVFGGLAGYVTFVIMLVCAALAPAVLATGLTPYLNLAFATELPPAPIAAVAILAAYVLGILNVRTHAAITGSFLLLELIAIGGVTIGAALSPHQAPASLFTPQMLGPLTLVPTPFATIATAVGTAIFAYHGYGMAILLAEDARGPARNIARAVVWSLALVLLAELAPLTAILLAARSVPALLAHPDPLGYVIAGLGHPALARGLAMGIALAIFNANVAVVIQLSRLLFASGRDQLWTRTLNRAFSAIHPRLGSPWIATLALMLPSAALALVSNLAALANMTVVLLMFIYFIVALAALLSRVRRADLEHSWKMPWWPAWPLLAMAGAGGALLATLRAAATADYVLLAGILATSVLGYIGLARRGVQFPAGPEPDPHAPRS